MRYSFIVTQLNAAYLASVLEIIHSSGGHVSDVEAEVEGSDHGRKRSKRKKRPQNMRFRLGRVPRSNLSPQKARIYQWAQKWLAMQPEECGCRTDFQRFQSS